ncbi:hypothetical protein [Methylophaga sp.]|uniref:hypothetical protein n=1 Tax=Methylophaga sp. TaxID=2024840 RepID=UPI003A93B4CC
MKKGNHQGKVLTDHKKVGQRLIPPFMQLDNLKEVSFKNNTLPCFIWVSALLLRLHDKLAVHCLIEFLQECHEIINDEKSPPLIFLNNFDKLESAKKTEVVKKVKKKDNLRVLRENLCHQDFLLKNYPLSFLFDDYKYEIDHGVALEMLKEDVSALLDRYSSHATKVQTTALVSMAATGKLFISSEINIPDFNVIFTHPESDEAKEVASFVRASINAGAGIQDIEGGENNWSNNFWEQVFHLEKCS